MHSAYSTSLMSDLLHMSQDVLPAVEHSAALLAVQLVHEVSGEVLVAVLVPKVHHKH